LGFLGFLGFLKKPKKPRFFKTQFYSPACIVYGPAALLRADDGDDAKKITCDILVVDAQKIPAYSLARTTNNSVWIVRTIICTNKLVYSK